MEFSIHFAQTDIVWEDFTTMYIVSFFYPGKVKCYEGNVRAYVTISMSEFVHREVIESVNPKFAPSRKVY